VEDEEGGGGGWRVEGIDGEDPHLLLLVRVIS